MSTDALTDLTTIEHLDFDPTVPCEAGTEKGGKHGAPADVLIVGQCPGCGRGSPRRYGSCWRHWRQAERKMLDCQACGHRDFMGGGFFRIVEVLR